MKLIIFLPALNEEEKIVKVLQTLPKRLAGIEEVFVLVIDDGSTDRTAYLASKAGAHVISPLPIIVGWGLPFKTAIRIRTGKQCRYFGRDRCR